MNVAKKTKITCKKAINEEKKAILEEQAKKTVELLQGAKLPPQGFKLDFQHAPPMVAKVGDAIG